MRSVAVRPDQPGFQRGVKFEAQRALGEGGQQIRARTFDHERSCLGEPPVRQGLAHARCADRHAVVHLPRNHLHHNVVAGKDFSKELIVAGGKRV